ncbi:MAG TPA: hypothetical protein VMI31_19030 [Fimbriimonadaceae bacterium]|nr:hypothetical protein [Fimbriimonadaceae bacterium]
MLQQGYATPLTIAEKDVTLPEICSEIAKDSGIKVELGDDLQNLKVTVFVKGMKARDLLDHLASLYDLVGTALSDRYRLKWDVKYQHAFEDYVHDEYLLRGSLVLAKVEALAKLTERPFGSPDAAQIPADAGDAMRWAAGKIGDAKYYAVGLWDRAGATVLPKYHDLDGWTGLITTKPCIFWVGEPAVPVGVRPPYAKCYIDANSRAIAGTTIAISCLETAAELQVRAITDGSLPPKPTARPFLFARPPKELAKSAFATRLAAWETKVDPKDLGPAVSADLKPIESPYFDHRISLSDKLENLHEHSDVSIIATSFRTPALKQELPLSTDPKALLDDLVGKEEVFARWDRGCLLVRHPAYWLLMCSEPPETVMQRAEQIARQRPMTLYEYAELAALLFPCQDDEPPWLHFMDPSGASSIQHGYERYIDGRGFLSRFDPDPLIRAYPALCMISAMSERDFDRLYSGETLNAERSWISGVQSTRPDFGVFTTAIVNGKKVVGSSTRPMGNRLVPTYSSSLTSAPEVAADFAPVFPAELGAGFVTIEEWKGWQNHATSPVDNPYDSLRAQFVSLKVDGNQYEIRLNSNSGLAVIYRFAIKASPRDPSSGGTGDGGR